MKNSTKKWALFGAIAAIALFSALAVVVAGSDIVS